MDLKTLRKVRAECDVQVPVIIRSSHDLASQVDNVIIGKPDTSYQCQIFHYDVDEEEGYVDFGKAPRGSSDLASYDGLIWWRTRQMVGHDGSPREGVFPTFVDMKDAKVYHRQDRSIYLPGEETGVKPHQCTREPRFLLSAYDRGLKVVDPSTRSVTDLRNPDNMADETEEDGMGVYVFHGYVGDNFDVRSMAPWSVFEYERDTEDGDDGDEGDDDEGDDDEGDDNEGDDDDGEGDANGDDSDGDDDDVIDLTEDDS